MEVAALGLRVDANGVDGAAKSLENLTAQGAKAEKAMAGVEDASSKAGKSLKTLGEGSSKGLEDINRETQQLRDEFWRLVKSTDDANKKLRDMNAEMEGGGKAAVAMTKATDALSSHVKTLAAAAAGISFAGLVKDSTMLAARFETMGVVMGVAGNNAGYTRKEMDELSKSLQQQGISMLQSRNSLTQLATANIDLSKATSLARSAQDLAVVGNINSSEALERMIHGIKAGEVEVLRTLGLNVSFEASYKKLAQTLGVNSESLDENQKMMARTNAVLEGSTRYLGIYEESMTTAGKAITSLTRYWEDFKVQSGDAFLPTLATGVFAVTDALKAMNAEIEASGQATDAVGRAINGTFKTTLETVSVLGANVAYVFRAMGLEIGGLAAQATAVARLDFSGAAEIGRQMKADAETNRAAIDRFSESVLNSNSAVVSAAKVSEEKRIADGKAAKAAEDAANKTLAQKTAFTAFTKQYGTDAEKAKIATEEWKAKLGDLWDPEMIAKIEKRGKAAAAAAKAEQTAYMGLKASIEERIALNQQEVNFSGRINEAQKAEIKLNEDLRSGKLKLTAADEATLRVRIEIWKQQEKQKDQAKREVAMYQQQSEAAQQVADDYVRQSKAIESVRVASDKADQALRDQLERMSVEEAMIGQTTAARELAVEMLDAEIERRNALKALDDNLDLDETVRQEQRIKVEERYALRVSLAQRKVYVSEWSKTSQIIGDTLQDYIMAGGENAAVYLKRLFSTLVLQPLVQGVYAGLIGGGGASGAAVTSLLGSGGSGMLSNLLFGGMSLTTVGSSIGAGIMATLTGSSLGGAGAAGILAGGSSALGMLGGALPYLGAGLAVLKILSGDWFGSRGPNHVGAAYSTTGVGNDKAAEMLFGRAAGDWYDDLTKRNNADLGKQLGKTVDSLAELYKTLGKIGGMAVRDVDIVAGFASNPKHGDEDSYGYFKILDKLTGEVLKEFTARDGVLGTDPQKAWEKFVGEMGGALIDEIKKGDIPGWMREELDTLGDNVTVEGLNTVIQKIAVIDAAFKGWADTVIGFANLTAKAQTELLKFSNGIEALANNVNAFYASFYSEQERAEILQRQVRDQLKKLGIDIDPAGGEAAKKAFRKLIEDALASGNNELAAKLLALAQLFGVAADAAQKSAEVAADAAKKAADEAQAAAEEMARVIAEERQKAKDAAMANFEAAVNREKEYWQGVLSSSQEAVQAITSILNPVKQAAKELFSSIESAGQMQAVQGMLYIERAIAGLRGGAKFSTYDGLTDAISAARGGITSGRYASQFERDRDALVLANQLKQIAGYGDTQLSVEERQLKNSQEQLQKLDKTLTYWRDLLDGNKAQIDATLSVEQAIKALMSILDPTASQPGAKPGNGGHSEIDFGGTAPGGSGAGSGSKWNLDAAQKDVNGGYSGYAVWDSKYQEALANSGGSVRELIEQFRESGGSLDKLAVVGNVGLGDLQKLVDEMGIPRFDVGTNRVPQDMLAMVHKNEAIVPAAFNPWAGGSMGSGNLEGLVQQLLSEAVQSREERRQQAGEIVRLNAQIARLLQRWDGDGLPHEREEATV